MPEDQVAELDNILGEILQIHPPQWELFEMTCRTVLGLAKSGHSVIVGRCGKFNRGAPAARGACAHRWEPEGAGGPYCGMPPDFVGGSDTPHGPRGPRT